MTRYRCYSVNINSIIGPRARGRGEGPHRFSTMLIEDEGSGLDHRPPVGHSVDQPEARTGRVREALTLFCGTRDNRVPKSRPSLGGIRRAG
jgi:hypothetical protein